MKLHVASNLSLPVDVCTQTLVVFGKRGSGKSSTATRMAEQLAAAGIPFAVLDPPDAWWGIKSSADGKSEGVKAYIFGGRHADLPLDASNGALLADVLVDHRVNVVMSLRHFSNLDRHRFVIEFAERLFQRNTEPLMLFCEEAHRLMPLDMREYGRKSRVEEMTGRMVKLITEGRTSGIGIASITQRPAMLNSTARNQSEILIAHRIIGPHDRAAIEDWIKYHREDDKKAEVLASLGELKTGDAWVWAPDFPEDRPIGLRRVHFEMPETFDSRRTPKAGEHRREPKAIAPVDLEVLRGKMTATIEKAKAEDPRELRKRIGELEKALKKSGAGLIHALHTTGAKPVEIPMERLQAQFDKGMLTERRRIGQEIGKILTTIQQNLGKILPFTLQVKHGKGTYNLNCGEEPLAQLDQAIERLKKTAPLAAHEPAVMSRPARIEAPRRPVPPIPSMASISPESNGDQKISKGGRKVLLAIAQKPRGMTQSEIAVLTGYKATSRYEYTRQLIASGWIVQNGEAFQATQAGVELLGDDLEALPTGSALRTYWLQKLPEGERRIFSVLCAAYPESVSQGEIGEAVNYKSTSVYEYSRKLAARQLIEWERGKAKAAAQLFEDSYETA